MENKLLDRYNNISRHLNPFTNISTKQNKQNLCDKLEGIMKKPNLLENGNVDGNVVFLQSNLGLLIRSLLLFKMERKSTLFSSKDKSESQEKHLKNVEDYLKEVNKIKIEMGDEQIKLDDVLGLVKNDSYLIQRQVTKEFKKLLIKLNNENKLVLQNYGNQEESTKLIKFCYENGLRINNKNLPDISSYLTNIKDYEPPIAN